MTKESSKPGEGFEPMTLAMRDWFGKPLENWPAELRNRVIKDLFSVDIWDKHDADAQRRAAAWWDCQNDPALKEQNDAIFARVAAKQEIERKIRQLELMNPQTPPELESKDRQLAALRRDLADLEVQGRRDVLVQPSAVADAAGCAVFRAMQNLTADEVTISFAGDKADSGLGVNNMLEISARGEKRIVAAATLDLVDRHKRVVNTQGAVLLGMASGKTLIRSEQNAKTISRLRGVLRKHLGIRDDPFHPYRKKVGWAPRLILNDKRGAADERAKRDAGFSTESYEELIERGDQIDDTKQLRRRNGNDASFDAEDDAAGQWLEENDSDGSA